VGQDRIAALVIAVVDIQAQHGAVAREGVAVAADRQVLQHHGRLLQGIHRAETPADARRILDSLDKWQRNLPIENRIADRVGGGADADSGSRDRIAPRADADHRHLGVLRRGSLLDPGPVLLPGPPAARLCREAHRLGLVAESQHNLPLACSLGSVAPDEGRGDDVRWKEGAVQGIGYVETSGRFVGKWGRRRCRLAMRASDSQPCGEDEHQARPCPQ